MRAKKASVILNKNVGLCVQTDGAKLPEDLLKALGDSLKFKATANQSNSNRGKGVDLCDRISNLLTARNNIKREVDWIGDA